MLIEKANLKERMNNDEYHDNKYFNLYYLYCCEEMSVSVQTKEC